MKTDIEIAQSANMRPITELAASMGIEEAYTDCYGRYKAKLDFHLPLAGKADGKLILVTAISPTPAGEGKTTTTVGLADALRRTGRKAIAALREPSLGPVFGVKGGAAGGGYAQVVPMEEINLHFTGDIHAIGAANNLLAAMLDNHIHHGNALHIDVRKITWRRCMDMNDRQLRRIVNGLGGMGSGMPREDGFDITVASEVMACLCLSGGIAELKERLGRIVVAYDTSNQPVTAAMLKAHGAMTALLKDALKPNLVQTLENTPAFIHGGPFANIAHGCNSVMATRMALKLGEYVVTEAGFGADLGAEKFIDIKCRAAGLTPSAAVIVATVRALKYHGGVPKPELAAENPDAVSRGMSNLIRHVENITKVFGLPAVVAVNRFPTDTQAELALIEAACHTLGVPVSLSEVWEKGGAGALDLAEKTAALCDTPSRLSYCYALEDSLPQKINAIASKLYRAGSVEWRPEAQKQLTQLEKLGFSHLPVCMAKTQYSFSDNPSLLGAPDGFALTVRELRLCAGAGFIVALTGSIMTMPGLPKIPSAENMDIDDAGRITGLF